MDEYAALGRVPVGPVWFLRADLLSLWPAADPETSRPPPPSQAERPKPKDSTIRIQQRQHSGTDYRQKDQPLVKEGVEGVRDGRFRNANDAARALADRAEGFGTPESKRARLQPQIKRALPLNADG